MWKHDNYVYLYIIFDKTGVDKKEIQARIIQARRVIGCLNSILWSMQITRCYELIIYTTPSLKVTCYLTQEHGD